MIKKDDLLRQLSSDSHTHAYLLVGGERQEVRHIFESFASKLDISLFDRHIVGEESKLGRGSIGIEGVRKLRERLSLKPHSSSHHLVLFSEAQALTVEAQNALLKILEEPPAPTVFFLATFDERLLLPTIASRCQPIRLSWGKGTWQEEGIEVVDRLLAIREQPLKEQFTLAETLARDSHLEDILDAWMLALRGQLHTGSQKVAADLKAIFKAKEHLQTTQANRRLILENLFLELTYGG
jgi:DNA polymerase III delta prime subunit